MTAIGYRVFSMQAVTTFRRSKRALAVDAELPASPAPATPLPTATLDRSPGAFARMLPGLIRLYLGEILRSPRFLTIVLGGLLLVIGNSTTLGSFYGTNTYPLTYKVLDLVSGLFSLFILIVTAIYTGELVWRERDTRMDDITDSTPAPTWLGFLAKLGTVMVLQAILMVVVMLCSIGVQLAKGFTGIELGHYLFELFVLQLPGYFLIAVLALLVHTLVDNKYLGHFLVLILFLVIFQLPNLGFEDRLYLYGTSPPVVYSDLNGYGHFLPAVLWFRLYWSAAAVLLLVLAYAFWVRGRDGRLAQPHEPSPGSAWARRHVSSPVSPASPSWRSADGSTTTRTCSTRSTRSTISSAFRPTTKSATNRSRRRRSPASPPSTSRSTSIPSSTARACRVR